MEKVVIIGAGSLQLPLIKKVRELGYESHVFAWEEGAVGKTEADYFYPISITEKEQILKICKELSDISGVVTIASDLAVSTVNYIARELGCVANSSKCDIIATNKFEMRKALLKAGIPTPQFVKVEKNNTLVSTDELHFPIIVKPTDRSGSRAITKLLDDSKIEEAICEARKISFERAAIVEEYIEGKEYSCECISYQGKHSFLAFTEKFTTGSPHFIEVGHIEPAQFAVQQQEKIKSVIFKALDALEIRNGASHCEFKVDDKGNVGIIEIGARMGGDFIGSDLVRISTGKDFVKMVIDVAVGKEPDFEEVQKPQVAAVRYLMTKKDILDYEAVEEQYKDKIFMSAKDEDGDDRDVVDSSSRLGYYVFQCTDYEEARRLVEWNQNDK